MKVLKHISANVVKIHILYKVKNKEHKCKIELTFNPNVKSLKEAYEVYNETMNETCEGVIVKDDTLEVFNVYEDLSYLIRLVSNDGEIIAVELRLNTLLNIKVTGSIRLNEDGTFLTVNL